MFEHPWFLDEISGMTIERKPFEFLEEFATIKYYKARFMAFRQAR